MPRPAARRDGLPGRHERRRLRQRGREASAAVPRDGAGALPHLAMARPAPTPWRAARRRWPADGQACARRGRSPSPDLWHWGPGLDGERPQRRRGSWVHQSVAPPVMPWICIPVEGLLHTRLSAVKLRPTLAICPCGIVLYHPVQAKLASSCTTKVMYLELKPYAVPCGQFKSKNSGVSPSSRPRNPLFTGSSLPHLDDGSLL